MLISRCIFTHFMATLLVVHVVILQLIYDDLAEIVCVVWEFMVCYRDPIFEPDGFNATYAEMEKATKNTISHRYKALDKLRDFLLSTTDPSKLSGKSI
mmetsp:Transcript_50734/g.94499  ORF Transcript_50734/g.94499 Transcript_50734/m.94499 type:complete len:98 (-) Transcript_50734:457-750(-)